MKTSGSILSGNISHVNTHLLLWDLFPLRDILANMSKRTPQGAAQPPQALVSAIRKLLRPLVRLMLSYQITYPSLITLLKSLYVEVAEEEFALDGKRQSDSRINLLTGVHRKDVKRLRAEQEQPSSVPSSISTGARVIAHWLGSEQFRDARGGPRALPLRQSASSGEPSFDDLVERVCRQDIRPRVILDEWQRLGIAHLDEQQRVVLDTGAFTPDQGFEEKAFFFGKNLQDHISAGAHNLLGGKPAHFDRSVYYDCLSAESVERLRERANEVGMQALQTINSEALALQQRDSRRDEENAPRYRINFGVFHYNTSYTSSREADPASENDSKGKEDA